MKEEHFQKVWDIFNRRASIREFEKRDIDEATISFLLECAATAPSSGNMQPWEFIVVRDSTVKQRIVETTFYGYFSEGGEHQNWIFDAPVVLIACANQKRTKARYGDAGKLWSIIDTSAAIQNLLIATSGIGLASCWVGGFDEKKLKKNLKIPSFVKPIGLIPIGYPKSPATRKSRLRMEIIRHENLYNHN